MFNKPNLNDTSYDGTTEFRGPKPEKPEGYKPPKATPFRAKKLAKEMLAREALAMSRDPMSLGLTEAEREQMAAADVAAASAQRQAQQEALARSAAGGADFQQGAFVDAQRAVADQAGAATSRASTTANDLSQQLVEGRTSRARAALAEEVQRKRKVEAFWRDLGIQGVTAALSAASGIPLGALMGTGQKTEGGEGAADDASTSDPSKYEGVV